MDVFFAKYVNIIVFLHVLSAIVWVGGMIVIRFAVHYSMAKIEDPKIKIGRTLENLQRFFMMVIPSILILLITAIFMILGFGFKGTSLYEIVSAKEVIWVVMSAIFTIIYLKRNQAQKQFESGEFKEAKETLAPLAGWMIPLNIILGIVAIFLGVTLRGL